MVKRLRQSACGIAAAASLLACAASCALWVRSHGRNDQLWRSGDGRVLYSWAGAVRYVDYRLDVAGGPGAATLTDGDPPAWRLAVPYAAPAAAAALPPAVWLARRKRAGRWSRRGLCPACGYDLRASPGRCPECGRERSRA